MQNKIFKNAFIAIMAVLFAMPVVADDLVEQSLDDMSADAVGSYEVDGTLFQKITDLEQEKVLMQLEKERAQLDLELDRLAAEKIKLHMEIDTLAGRAEEQQAALDNEREKLEAERARLEQMKQASSSSAATPSRPAPKEEEPEYEPIAKRYSLIDIIGAGKQLHATVQDLNNGQRKKISVGRELDGYTVKSISLDDGVVFVKDEITQTLNISKER